MVFILLMRESLMAAVFETLSTMPSKGNTGETSSDTKIEQDRPRFKDLTLRIKRTNLISSQIFISKKTLPPTMVTDKVVEEIVQILNSDPTITSLILNSSAILSPKHQLAILRAACSHGHLSNLALCGIHIKDIPLEILHALLKLPLSSLILYNYQISNLELDDSVVRLISQNRTLKFLGIVDLKLTDAAIKMIINTPSLERICLEETHISATGQLILVEEGKFRSIDIFDDAEASLEMPNDLQQALFQSNTLEWFASSHLTPDFFRTALQDSFLINRRTNLSPTKVTYIHDHGLNIYTSRHVHPDLSERIANNINTGSIEETRTLIETCGYSLNCFTLDHGNYDRNPLVNNLIANESHSDFIIQLLRKLKEFINPNEFDYEWKNALIIAAKVYSADTIFLELLKIYGKTIDINARDIAGRTALHYICAYRRDKLLAILLNPKFSADISAEDFQGRTLLDYCNLTQTEVEEILCSININPKRDTHSTANRLIDMIHGFNENFNLRSVISGEEYSNCNSSVISYEELNQMDATLSNLKKLKKLHLTSVDSATWEKLNKEYEEMEKRFAGKSLISTIMKPNPALRAALLQHGAVDTKSTKATVLTASEIPALTATSSATLPPLPLVPFFLASSPKTQTAPVKLSYAQAVGNKR